MAHIAELLAAGRTYSFEFSPPGTEAGWLTLGRTIAELDVLHPSFVSVTYGAGGGTRRRTHEAVAWIRKETPVTPMAHLTCVSHTRDEIGEILDAYDAVEVENILALAGDAPNDPANARPSEYRYALELVEHVRDHNPDFSIGVAAHPEVHPRALSAEADRDHLAAKLRIADFAITQFFFEVDAYLRLVDDLAARDIDKPVIPGIMPITNIASVARMAQLERRGDPGVAHRPARRGGRRARCRPRCGCRDRHRTGRGAARRRRARPALLHAQPLHRDPRDLRQPRSGPLSTARPMVGAPAQGGHG